MAARSRPTIFTIAGATISTGTSSWRRNTSPSLLDREESAPQTAFSREPAGDGERDGNAGGGYGTKGTRLLCDRNALRSEDLLEWKECVRSCRSLLVPYQYYTYSSTNR